MAQKTIHQITKDAADTVGFFDAEYLLAYALGKTREWIAAHGNDAISNIQYSIFKKALKKRKRGVPAAYLTGHQEFYGLDFLVNKHVLVPRPATELLVDCALKTLAANSGEKTLVADVGTGSGCVAVAIAKSAKTLWPNRRISGVATDISRRALRIAKKNAARHGVDVTFLHGNLLEPIFANLQSEICNLKSEIIITANLPYLTKNDLQQEQPPRQEPHLSLLGGGANGLELYETLLRQIRELRDSYKGTLTLLCEMHPEQIGKMKNLVNAYLPGAPIDTHKDLAGFDRMLRVVFD